ncbi:VapC toxin family PIN domain ribonuclease [Tabrizicola sp. TH137]|uniref:PIN domain-containing protein n=1 Tax=Tabrizicola sp. TH137 TaxID=2067452 RepID=UPI000C7C93FF|nr:PIN domain-containing protein [Tabrizicola sp. TH137]PLL14385.1 VapC toxin family PIN domain ribonuclease [Tabrizicola sp. TH137]
MGGDFIDSNVILYLLDDGPKADRAEAVLAAGGTISVQVLNEVLVNCVRKAGMDLAEAGEFLAGIRRLCPVLDLTVEVHDAGRAVAARYGLSVYDSMIVAAALVAGCDRVLSEDMQDGLVVEGVLRVVNPFA